MDLRARLVAVAESVSSLIDAISFLAQWVLYRVVAALEPLRERLPRIARDDDLWVFGARGGEAFVDNAKYLYLHATAERPEIRAVWLSKNTETVAELQSAGYEAYHAYSLRGLLLNLRAGVVVLTQGHRDLVMPCCGGAFTVLLWHGIPIKHVSWDAGFRELPAPLRTAHSDVAEEFDLLTIPGRNLADLFASGLRIDRDRMAVVGYPRNDTFTTPIPGEEVGTDTEALARIRELADDDGDDHALVFYLPTFREWTDGSAADHLDLPALDGFLAEQDAYLVVKTHPKERLDLPDGLSRIVQLPQATDPYPFLRLADALVTDYSSVYFDFLVADRPVVFYPYDLEEYQNRRGFYFDYEDVTPGPVARNFEELLAGLDRALARPNADAGRRRDLRNRLLDGDPASVADSSGEGASDSGTDESGGLLAAEASASAGNCAPVAPRSAAVYELVRERLARRNRKTAQESGNT